MAADFYFPMTGMLLVVLSCIAAVSYSVGVRDAMPWRQKAARRWFWSIYIGTISALVALPLIFGTVIFVIAIAVFGLIIGVVVVGGFIAMCLMPR